MFGPILLLTSIALLLIAGTGTDGSMKAAHNTTVELTCVTSDGEIPFWYMDGSFVLTQDGYSNTRDDSTGDVIGTLIINGNQTCGTFLCSCRLGTSGPITHNFNLTVDGPLPPPEDIHINESNNSLIIEWNSPYSAINTNSSIIQMDPHITQYTVYILDYYTNYEERVNITETSFRNTPNGSSCPVYRVTAWNSGGEGERSVPLPGAPKSLAAEDIDILREAGALDIRLRVTDPCTVRIPDYFLVTVMSTDGMIITTVQHPVTTIRVTLPQNVDNCNLIVRVSAGNSAGTSLPTEKTVNGCQTTDPTTAPTQYTTTSLPVDATTSDLGNPRLQGDNNIIYIAIGIPVGAVVIVTTAALLLIILWKCKRNTKVEPPGENVYSKSPSLGGPPVYQPDSPPVYSPPVYSPPAVYAITESHSRTSSTQSSGSETPLLPPAGAKSAIQVSTGVSGVVVSLQSSTSSYPRSGPKAPEGNPQLVYARIDPAKHSQPLPPASDNQVQYAQIDYQEKL